MGPTLAFVTACIPIPDLSAIRQLTFELYQELLDTTLALGTPRLVRIWNYIPDINSGDGDNECYRQFCWGRADALEGITLPAATGIGSRDGYLRISALCTGPADSAKSLGIRHIENPRQLSAYRYPKDYGPRSPSFARATLVSPPEGVTAASLLLVSGTSSIVDHQTLHAGDIAAQTAESLRNIQALFKSVDSEPVTKRKPESMELTDPVPLSLRYYLRQDSDLALARSSWTANAGHWPSPVWYEGDICRSDLSMEIEGVFSV